MKRRIIFHIGLEKTGTTSLQHFSFDNKDVLARNGIAYPTANLAFGVHNHAGLAAAYLGDRPADYTIVHARGGRHDVVASLIADIKRADQPLVLVSSEHLSSRFGPAEIANLWTDFAGYDCRIVVVVRNHRARFFSSYATHVASGGETDLTTYADEMLGSGAAYLRAGETIERWRAVFGQERITLLDYDAHDDIVPAFFATCCPIPIGMTKGRRYSDKTALSPAATESVRRINAHVAARQRCLSDHLYVWMQRRYFQRRLMARIAALDARRPPEPWRLDPLRDRRLDDLAAADAVWLRDHLGFVAAPPRRKAPAPVVDGQPQAACSVDRAWVDARLRFLWPIGEAILAGAMMLDRCRTRSLQRVAGTSPK